MKQNNIVEQFSEIIDIFDLIERHLKRLNKVILEI